MLQVFKSIMLIAASIPIYCYAIEIPSNELNMSRINIPKTVSGNKSPTFNGTGYIFYNISPIGTEFLKDECIPNKKVIDIGAGFSNIPIEALRAGVTKYTANDTAIEHLQILVQRIRDILGESTLNNLSLLHGIAPKDLPAVRHEYDAILADKVIHFMQPEEIVEFIAWAKQALKPGGKIYVTTASPYSQRYNNMLPVYLERLNNGDKFPGHFTNLQQFINITPLENYENYIVPDTMVLFSRNDLVTLFERNGMKVMDSYSLKIPTDEDAEWKIVPDIESNLVGIIASY